MLATTTRTPSPMEHSSRSRLGSRATRVTRHTLPGRRRFTTGPTTLASSTMITAFTTVLTIPKTAPMWTTQHGRTTPACTCTVLQSCTTTPRDPLYGRHEQQALWIKQSSLSSAFTATPLVSCTKHPASPSRAAPQINSHSRHISLAGW